MSEFRLLMSLVLAGSAALAAGCGGIQATPSFDPQTAVSDVCMGNYIPYPVAAAYSGDSHPMMLGWDRGNSDYMAGQPFASAQLMACRTDHWAVPSAGVVNCSYDNGASYPIAQNRAVISIVVLSTDQFLDTTTVMGPLPTLSDCDRSIIAGQINTEQGPSAQLNLQNYLLPFISGATRPAIARPTL